MRVSFLKALEHKWQRAIAGQHVFPTTGSSASVQLLSEYLRVGSMAATTGPAADWKQVLLLKRTGPA